MSSFINDPRVDGVDVRVARVDGPPDVFSVARFVLARSRWMADQEATVCYQCQSKFSSLRRRHHCRQCGLIFCANCCFNKVELPQLGCTSPERVCEGCRPAAQLVTKTLNKTLPCKLHGAKGLVEMLNTPHGLQKVCEVGGVQALVFLVQTCDEHLWATVCSGLNTLATNPSLHGYLIETGAVKAISRILNRADPHNQNMLSEGLSILSVFCKSSQVIPLVLSHGAMDPLLSLISSTSEAIVLMALRVLSQVVEDVSTHNLVALSKQTALSKIFACTFSTDEQTQEAALRVLALLALGSNDMRQRLTQEDIFSGHSTQQVLCSRPNNIQVLVNATCLVANLAASEHTQGALKDLILPLCRLLDDLKDHPDLMSHTARGVANFSRTQQHAQLLIPYVTTIFTVFVKSPDTAVRYQGLRTMISLLTFFPQQTLVVLQQEDIGWILKGLTKEASISDSILKAINNKSPSAQPLKKVDYFCAGSAPGLNPFSQ